jgi:hypothetical protein
MICRVPKNTHDTAETEEERVKNWVDLQLRITDEYQPGGGTEKFREFLFSQDMTTKIYAIQALLSSFFLASHESASPTT